MALAVEPCHPPSEHNEFLCRYNFHTRIQLPDESIDQFVLDLWKLGSKCHFSCDGNLTEALVRDRFVVGLQNKNAQKQLLALSRESQEFVQLEKAISYLKENYSSLSLKNAEKSNSTIKTEELNLVATNDTIIKRALNIEEPLSANVIEPAAKEFAVDKPHNSNDQKNSFGASGRCTQANDVQKLPHEKQ